MMSRFPPAPPSSLKVDDLCDSGLTLLEVSKAVVAAGALIRSLGFRDKGIRDKAQGYGDKG